MSFIATDLISSCIEKTRRFLFPINKKLWLKLGLVTLLAGGWSGSSFNYNFRNPGVPAEAGQSISSIFGELFVNYWHWIVIGFLVILGLGLLGILIRSIFNYILIDSVKKERCLIGKSWSETASLAFRYFFAEAGMYLIFTALMVAAMMPMVEVLLNYGKELSYNILSPYLWTSLGIVLFLFLIWLVIYFMLYHLVMPDIYFKRTRAFRSIKHMGKLALKNISQVLIYLLMRIVLGIAAAFISIIIFLLVGLIFLVIAGIIVLIGLMLSMIPGSKVILIVLGVGIGLILFLLLIFAVQVILVPIEVFFTNYRLDFYSSLVNGRRRRG